jgi:hypothetical protein
MALENGSADVKPVECVMSQELREYLEEGRAAFEKMDAMRQIMANVVENTNHLGKLDSIALSIDTIRGTVLEAATGRKQVPLSIALTMCAILGVALLCVIVAKSQTDISASMSGVKVSHHDGTIPGIEKEVTP